MGFLLKRELRNAVLLDSLVLPLPDPAPLSINKPFFCLFRVVSESPHPQAYKVTVSLRALLEVCCVQESLEGGTPLGINRNRQGSDSEM